MARKRQNRRRVKPEDRVKAIREVGTHGLRVWGPRVALAAVGLAIPYAIYVGYFHVISGPTFLLKTIEVSGVERLSEEDVLEASGVSANMNIFDVEILQVEESVEAMPWVKEALVERELPDTLRVRIDEWSPEMVLVDSGYQLVGDNGKVFKTIDPQDNVDELLALPILTGLTSSDLERESGRELFHEAKVALQAFRAEGLEEFVALSEVHVDPVLGVSLVAMDGGCEIRLGTGKMPERMKRLRIVLSRLQDEGETAEYILLDHESELGRVIVGRTGWASKDASQPNRQ